MTSTAAIHRTIAGASVVWAMALPAATVVAATPSHTVWQALAFAVYGLGSVICHQASERSFVILDAQLPVCARCTGLYVGAAAVSILWARRESFDLSSPLLGVRHRAWRHPGRVLLLGSMPTAATLAWEWMTGDMPANPIRALAGVALGLAVMSLLLGRFDAEFASSHARGLADRGRPRRRRE